MTRERNTYASLSDVGRLRRDNEDAHGQFADPAGALLLVVCDGVGGHDAGEVASRVAVESIGRALAETASLAPLERLAKLVDIANEEVMTEGARIGVPDMGTTLAALLVIGNEAYAVNVGDSRIYQFRNGQVLFRSKDHTRVRMLIDAGLLGEHEACTHRDAHMITRALGRRTIHDGTRLRGELYGPLLLSTGDTFVLNSDGLHDMLADVEIAETLSGRTAVEATNELVHRANAAGGADNITATVYIHGALRVPGELAAQRSDSEREIVVGDGLLRPQTASRSPLPLLAAALLFGLALWAVRCHA